MSADAGSRTGLATRAVLFTGTRDLVPLYALYALLFADHGLSAGQISSLLALWSITAFVLEVPSGAWADAFSRRGLLIAAGILLIAAFITWTLWPGYAGFALGFVLWGVAGALSSGTFEALLYDALTALDATADYPKVLGWTRAGAELTVVAAILAAAPLYAWGGYALVGWVSVGCAVLHTLTAVALPATPRTVGIAEIPDEDDGPSAAPVAAPTPATPPKGTVGPLARWIAMLRAGLGEALRHKRVRHGVLLAAALYGVTSYDEYFGLLAQDGGVSTVAIPLLVGVTVLGSLAGSLLAGRAAALPGRIVGLLVGAGALLLAAGAWATGTGAGTAAVVAGFVAMAAGYGIGVNAEVVADARLQEAIDGPARATVTSVSGLLSEVVALAVFGFVALATATLSLAATMALLGLSVLAIAAVTPAWLPGRRG